MGFLNGLAWLVFGGVGIKEAIMVMVEGLGKIGYVANSPYTVIGESMSAGRVYDKIGDTAIGEVVFVTTQGTLCRVCKKSLLGFVFKD